MVAGGGFRVDIAAPEFYGSVFGVSYPKGPCTQTVYRYFRAKVYTIWAHGPLVLGLLKGSFKVLFKGSIRVLL